MAAAKQILTDAYIAVGGTVWSDYANNVAINMDIDDVEVTSFGPSAMKEYAQGMADATITCTFFQSFEGGTASLDSMLYNLWQGRGTFSVEVRPTSSNAGSANPKYTMVSRLYNYTPLDGGVGDASTIDCTFRNSGTAGIVRGTS